MRTTLRLLYFSLFLISLFQPAGAIGRVYARLPNNANSPIYNLRIKTLTANIIIKDQLAITHVDQTFANDNTARLEGFYVFALPEGAQVNELYLWINGARVPYIVKKKEEAIVQYNEIVQKLTDPAILQELGNNLFKLQIFPFEPSNTRRIEIVYTQPMHYTKGSLQYTFPLDMKNYTSAPIEQVTMTFDIRTSLAFSGIETSVDQFPTAAEVTKIDSTHYTVTYGVENVAFANDFFIRAGLAVPLPAMQSLTYTNPKSITEKPFFVLWATTPDSLIGDTTKPRQMTFVADVSSSMEGLRISQLKDILNAFVDVLTEKDRFNIIVFSTTVAQFRSGLVPMTPAARDSAKLFIHHLSALGLTNIEAALKKAFEQSYADSLRSMILFLTDGQPSWGETNADSIIARASRWNTSSIPLSAVGVGEDLDHALLIALAKNSGASYTRIGTADSMFVKVKEIYRKTILPPLQQLTMGFGSFDAYDVHPTPLPSMYAGDQLTLTGRFSQEGTFPLFLNGTVDGTPFALGNSVSFNTQDTVTVAIARMWGAQKIKSLLAMIDAVGEQEELVEQVVDLSIAYSVLTPYTAFLVIEPVGTPGTGVRPLPVVASDFSLRQNFPNPFNPSTTISYMVPHGGWFVTITVYDLLGRSIRILVAQAKNGGEHRIVWDGKDDAGRAVPSGVYIYRLQSESVMLQRTMMYLK